MKSRQKNTTKYLIAIEIFLLIFLIFCIFVKPEFTITYLVFIILLLYNLKSIADSVTIDANGIVINNWLTTEKRTYGLDQFDNVVLYIDPVETRDRFSFYLQKNDVIFCKIRGRNYENLNDLIMELKKIKKKEA